jgi:hypothetical protein
MTPLEWFSRVGVCGLTGRSGVMRDNLKVEADTQAGQRDKVSGM